MSLSNKQLAIIFGAVSAALIAVTTILVVITPKPADLPVDGDQSSQPGSNNDARLARPSFPVDDEAALAVQSLTETYHTPDFYVYGSLGENISPITELNNKDLEAKINQDIQDICSEILQEVQEYPKGTVYAPCYATAAPGDTLSFSAQLIGPYLGEVFAPDGFDYEDGVPVSVTYRVVSKNYRLDTGQEFKFDDLFVADTDLIPIVAKAAYEAVHCRTNYCSGGGITLFPKIADIDEEVLRIVQRFRDTEDVIFSFNNRDITVWIDDYQLDIRMEDWYDKIAIFKRFKSAENLYEVAPVAPQFVFSRVANYKNDFVSDNLFARISINNFSGTAPNAIVNRAKELADYVTNQAISRVKGQNDFYILEFQVDTGVYQGIYYTDVPVGCGSDGSATFYCARLGKLSLRDLSQTNAIEAIATAARDRGHFGGYVFEMPNIVNVSANLFSDIDGYATNGSNAWSTGIRHNYNESGSRIR